MGSIMSQSSSPKLKGEDSSLIEIPEDDLSRETEDIIKINEVIRSPTDPDTRQFVKTFYQLQKQKEQFHLQLHNEVLQWRLMYQRGIAYKFEHNDKVNMLIKEFVRLHEQLDEFLEQERSKLELILPKPRYFMPTGCKDSKKKEKRPRYKNTEQTEKETLELTPEAMQRLVCFQKCNDQHILVLTQVLSDIEDCKTFAKAQKASTPSSSEGHSLSKQTSLTESAGPSSDRPITITVSTDSEENAHS